MRNLRNGESDIKCKFLRKIRDAINEDTTYVGRHDS